MQHHNQVMEEKAIKQLKLQIVKFIKDHNGGALETMLLHHFSTPGKLIRPRLVFRLAKALGLTPVEVQGWAMSCELLHNATLIHDDLQDGDRLRRGVPTVWAKFGANMAINAGDQLLLLAPKAIGQLQVSAEKKLLLHDRFIQMATSIVDGQSREFELNQGFYSDAYTTAYTTTAGAESCFTKLYDDYIACIRGKTAALFSHLAAGVGQIAGLTSEQVQQLESIFEQLGIIFQVQDDLLDLFGEKQRECIGCDLKEGKVSYLVVKHLGYQPNDNDKIKALLQKSRDLTTAADIDWFKNRLIETETYQKCIRDFQLMTTNLLENPLLAKNERLREVVSDVLDQVLSPVEHLLKDLIDNDNEEFHYASAIF